MIKLLSFFFLFIGPALGQVDWRGHQRLIGTSLMGLAPQDDWESSQTQLVLNHRSTLLYAKGVHNFEFAYELFALDDQYNNDLILRDPSQRFPFRGDDLNYYLVNERKSNDQYQRVVQNLDRFFYTYSVGKIEANLGRQPIAFGVSRFINPLDILVPFNFTVINFESRFGVDGARFKYAFSDMGLLDFGVVYDKELSSADQYHFLSVRETYEQTDVLLIYQSLKQHKVYGIELQTDIFNWGVWLDYAYFDIKQLDDFVRYSLGAQYFFENEINFFAEYHFNGANAAGSDLGVFVIGEEYINLGCSYPITPIHNIGLSSLNNIEDGSQFLNTNYQYNFSQDWYAELGLYFGQGQVKSEFENYPQIVFFGLKNFF